jgi:hypothetical protein
MSTAADAGDLKKVKQLQAVKEKLAANEKPSDEEAKDAALSAAVVQRDQAVAAADRVLGRAYDDAVAGYTRARKIPDAEAVEAERAKTLATTKPADADAGDVATAGETVRLDKLVARLPSYLQSADAAGIKKDGLSFSDARGIVRTKDGKFLEQDFTFDVVFEQVANVDRQNRVTIIGLGDPSYAGGYANAQNAVYVKLNTPVDGDGWVEVSKNGTGGSAKLEKVPGLGTRMVRVEKRGDAVTFSLCVDFKDKFTADSSHTIPDIRQYAPFLTKHNTYLFIGGSGTFKACRLVKSSPAK